MNLSTITPTLNLDLFARVYHSTLKHRFANILPEFIIKSKKFNVQKYCETISLLEGAKFSVLVLFFKKKIHMGIIMLSTPQALGLGQRA
jgi:hypothetical protein